MMRVGRMMIRTTMIAAATVIDAVHILFICIFGGFDNSLACPDKEYVHCWSTSVAFLSYSKQACSHPPSNRTRASEPLHRL